MTGRPSSVPDNRSPKPTFGRESASRSRQNVDFGGDLVRIPSQTTAVGSDDHYPEERPAQARQRRRVLDPGPPGEQRQFTEFVDATGYVTVAERPLNPADYPDAPAENLQPGSMVFTRTQGPVDLRHLNLWWTWTPGASWRHPVGAALVDRETRRPSGGSRRLRGRRVLCAVGGALSADRGGMGNGGPRRPRGRDVHVG